MHIAKTLLSSQTVLLAIALGFPAPISPAWAQSAEQPSIQNTQTIFNDPTPPRQGSPTGRQRGGASRGPCRQFASLTALVPATKGKVWGQTISDRPTFWFYLPHPLTEQTPIEFTLQDSTDTDVYSTRLAVANIEPGLIRLQMPASAKALEVGKSYTWTFSVYCDPTKPSSAVFVKGMIQRTAPDATLQNRLKTLSALDQTRLYAANGLWYDAFDTLATLYRQQLNDRQLSSIWATLLKQVNLGDLTTAPFSSCCTLKP